MKFEGNTNEPKGHEGAWVNEDLVQKGLLQATLVAWFAGEEVPLGDNPHPTPEAWGKWIAEGFGNKFGVWADKHWLPDSHTFDSDDLGEIMEEVAACEIEEKTVH